MNGAAAIAAAPAFAAGAGHAQAPRPPDGFDGVDRWTAWTPDGVEAALHGDHGARRADVDHHGGAVCAVLGIRLDRVPADVRITSRPE